MISMSYIFPKDHCNSVEIHVFFTLFWFLILVSSLKDILYKTGSVFKVSLIVGNSCLDASGIVVDG